MNDGFLNSFIHNEHPHDIQTISRLCNLDTKENILHQCAQEIQYNSTSPGYLTKNEGQHTLLLYTVDIHWIYGQAFVAFPMSLGALTDLYVGSVPSLSAVAM
jgi:hypothetical protein